MRSKAPIAREISWLSTVPQLIAVATAIGVGWWVTSPDPTGVLWGAGAYLTYSIGSRLVIARAHRAGIARVRRGEFEKAIPFFEDSFRRFTNHAWMDRFRSIVLMSSSASSYREMALVNIAFCYSQLGRGAEAKAIYQRALKDYPQSSMAASALRLIDAAEASRSNASGAG